ncbi:hypothetical protein H072_6432 [Dactylellina haptotyla CBS 200.50]|uniref:Calcofluor white hypersensitive protein n=1 Tax=Dactylellina haptotyla (strain CBS 200.50) TaxID=1284197 RepID=S8BWQ2_DACHA|nr:hypothetical protein H072_6432 [Dactylellina haptotyla CBS 200.50]
MAAKKSNMPLLLGAAAAIGGGYYYYTTGGDTKAAQAKFEHDTTAAREHAQATYDSVKASATSAADLGKHKLEDAQAKLDAERKKAQTEIQQKIDEADKKIQDGATKAKGWFGRG